MGRSSRQASGSADKPVASGEYHRSVVVHEGDGGLPPDPIHGEVTFTGFRSWCDCALGKDHGVKWLGTKAVGVRSDTKVTSEPLTGRELAYYLNIKPQER